MIIFITKIFLKMKYYLIIFALFSSTWLSAINCKSLIVEIVNICCWKHRVLFKIQVNETLEGCKLILKRKHSTEAKCMAGQ